MSPREAPIRAKMLCGVWPDTGQELCPKQRTSQFALKVVGRALSQLTNQFGLQRAFPFTTHINSSVNGLLTFPPSASLPRPCGDYPREWGPSGPLFSLLAFLGHSPQVSCSFCGAPGPLHLLSGVLVFRMPTAFTPLLHAATCSTVTLSRGPFLHFPFFF